MKIDELRKLVAGYDQETLRRLVAELYKMIPKQVRENSALDELIQSFPDTGKIPKRAKAADELINDFSELSARSMQLVEYAAIGYYYAPNRVVPKSARSKWRFAVRRLLKSLIAIKGEHSQDAALLLVEMYRMLSYACSRYIFSTETPFKAVGFAQPELLEIIFAKLFSGGLSKELVRLAVYVIMESHTDRETVHAELRYPLLKQLKTADARTLVLEECAFFIEHFRDASVRPYTSQHFLMTYNSSSWNIDYSNEVTERCAELYLVASLALHEHEKGIKFFKKHYRRRDPEVSLFCMLLILLGYAEDSREIADVWFGAYDQAVAKGIAPRTQLQKWRDELNAKWANRDEGR